MLSALALEALIGAPSLHRTGERGWSKKHVLISFGQSVVWLIIISVLVFKVVKVFIAASLLEIHLAPTR